MTVERISKDALHQLVKGSVRREATCVIKFYSNGCHLCHALKNDYEQISNQFEDILFFAFNIDDHEDIDNILPINGVPSVCLINTGAHKNIVTLEDPESPNEETWFERQYIENFIDREKR